MAVTVYTPSPALSTSNNNANINFRHVIQLSGTPNGQLRVTFKSGTAISSVRGAAIGKWNGTTIAFANGPNMVAAAVRVTFGGGNTASSAIASGATETSDFVTAPSGLASGDWVVVTSLYTSGWGTEQVYSDGHSTAVCWFTSDGTDYSQVQNVVAYNSSGTTVNPGAGSNGRNFSVNLIETNDPSGGGAVAVAGLSPMGEGITHSRNARGTLHPIGRGWTGWRRQGKLIVPDRKLLRRA